MNTTKLTLSIEPQLVSDAKRLAASLHTSLSAVFSRLLRALSTPTSATVERSPVTRRATGLVKLPGETSDQELLTDALSEKYSAQS